MKTLSWDELHLLSATELKQLLEMLIDYLILVNKVAKERDIS